MYSIFLTRRFWTRWELLQRNRLSTLIFIGIDFGAIIIYRIAVVIYLSHYNFNSYKLIIYRSARLCRKLYDVIDDFK